MAPSRALEHSRALAGEAARHWNEEDLQCDHCGCTGHEGWECLSADEDLWNLPKRPVERSQRRRARRKQKSLQEDWKTVTQVESAVAAQEASVPSRGPTGEATREEVEPQCDRGRQTGQKHWDCLKSGEDFWNRPKSVPQLKIVPVNLKLGDPRHGTEEHKDQKAMREDFCPLEKPEDGARDYMGKVHETLEELPRLVGQEQTREHPNPGIMETGGIRGQLPCIPTAEAPQRLQQGEALENPVQRLEATSEGTLSAEQLPDGKDPELRYPWYERRPWRLAEAYRADPEESDSLDEAVAEWCRPPHKEDRMEGEDRSWGIPLSLEEEGDDWKTAMFQEALPKRLRPMPSRGTKRQLPEPREDQPQKCFVGTTKDKVGGNVGMAALARGDTEDTHRRVPTAGTSGEVSDGPAGSPSDPMGCRPVMWHGREPIRARGGHIEKGQCGEPIRARRVTAPRRHRGTQGALLCRVEPMREI